ncbi:MAG: hypothetical protein KDE31_04590 [Caldilineaceae bacterium]|nr:hypothetical protein [Caldilineaceae bacterium]MCB0183516.1 hypothetical protein [Caldilineaceae bacterium]
MTQMLFYTHSGWRYIVLLVLIVAIVKLLIGLLGKQSWSKFDQILGVATPIVIDIQWLLGIVLWIMQQRWLGNDPLASWEHPVTMTLALAAAHIGWTRAKRAESSQAKFQAAFIGFLIAGILVGLGVARITKVM